MKNRMVKAKGFGIAILAVALAALLLFTACARAPTTLEGNTVEVAAIWPITGAAAASMQLCMSGTQDCITYFNEQEAIPGVTIKFLWGDTSLQLAQFMSHYEKLLARGVPLIFAMDSWGLMWLKGRSAKDNVAILGGFSTLQDICYSVGSCYFQCPTLAEQFAVVAQYFRENWKEERPPRLAFVGIDSAWGYEPQAEGTKYAQSLGFEVLPPEILPYVVLDATTNLARLKAEGADLVYLQTLVTGTGPTLRDADRLGLLGQMHFAGTESGMGDQAIDMTGAAGEGYLFPFFYPWFGEIEVPGIKLILHNQMKYHGKEEREMPYLNGWVEAALACEAVKRAIENVGYENLDGVAIKQALDNMKDFDVYGLASITYRPLDYRGATKVAVYQIRGGEIVRVTDWREVPSLVPEGLVGE